MKAIDHTLQDVILTTPLFVAGGVASLAPVYVTRLTSVQLTYLINVVFEETKEIVTSGNIFKRTDGTIVAVTDEGEQVQIASGAPDG